MAQVVEFPSISAQTGMSAKLFAIGNDTVVASVTPTEATNRLGTFTASYSGVTVGIYKLKCFLSSGYPVTDTEVNITASSGYFEASDIAVEEAAILTAVSGVTGSGANTVTITVTDLSNVPIQFATVSAVSGPTTYGTATTDVNGVANIPSLLKLNNGTYTINVTAGGFNGGGGTLVVSGATSRTYTMSPIMITPSTPPEVTGYLTCYDQNGNALAGVSHFLTMTQEPSGSTGTSFSRQQRTVQSDATGLVQFTGMIAGATYQIKRGTNGNSITFNAGNTTFAIPDISGT